MNLYNEIRTILEEQVVKNEEYNIIDKIVVIYTKLCEQFNYDVTWLWAAQQKDHKRMAEVLNKDISILKVEDEVIACGGFASAYKRLADMLLSDDENYIETNIIMTNKHRYAKTMLEDDIAVELDPFDNETASDILNIKKGLTPCGITIIDNKSHDEEKEDIIKQQALKSIKNNNNLYLQYLHLLKEELLENKKTTYEIFNYFKDTTNVSSLGLKEVNDLFALTMNKVTNKTQKELNIGRLILFNPEKEEIKFLYSIPNKNNKEHYCLEKQDQEVTWKKINDPVKYIDNYQSNSPKKIKYLK